MKGYAGLVAPLLEKSTVRREKGSPAPILWDPCDIEAFEATKASLLEALSLQTVDPDRLFVFRVDSSNRAMGEALEKLPRGAEA